MPIRQVHALTCGNVRGPNRAVLEPRRSESSGGQESICTRRACRRRDLCPPSQAVQCRLPIDQVAELVRSYQAGESADLLADAFQIHRTTVTTHLQRNRVQRRGGGRVSRRRRRQGGW